MRNDTHQAELESPALARPEDEDLLSGIVPMLLSIWRERRFIAFVTALGFVLSLGYVLTLEKTYDSTTKLMPPEGASMASSLLAGIAGESIASIASDALNVHSPGAIFVAVLHSRPIQDSLIDRYQLMQVYKAPYRLVARQRLGGESNISEDRLSGVITITVRANSPQLAQNLARGYVEELNRLMAQLDTSAAGKERQFLEERLAVVRKELDDRGRMLSEFSKKNRTLDVKEQTRAMVDAAANVQGEIIALRSQETALLQMYKPDDIRVRSLQARISELERQMNGMDGKFGALSAPGFQTLPSLGMTYADLYRELKVQESVYETLTKQYELAKVQEARAVPTVRVLEEADLPERKSGPQRIAMVLLTTVMAAFFSTLWVFGRDRWQTLEPAHPIRVLFSELREGLHRDSKMIRMRLHLPAAADPRSEKK